MSDAPRDFTLERLNRLSQALDDVMDGLATHARNTQRLLELMRQQLDRIEANQASIIRDLRVVASRQILMANRVEEAIGRAFHTGRRLDELEHGVHETPGATHEILCRHRTEHVGYPTRSWSM